MLCQEMGQVIRELGESDGFGEKALLAPTEKLAIRTATIVANEPVECIILNRQSFLSV